MTTDAAPRATARSPLGSLRPVLALVGVYTVALLVWLVAGDALPGGRWFAAHLFTLGVVTNLVTAMSAHFAETVLHVPDRGRRLLRLGVLNAGVAAMLVGRLTNRVVFAVGATVVLGAVTWLYLDLRGMRRSALNQRFAFVVRAYERACGAFTHGAILGILLGTGLLTGSWHSAGRLAHLHVTILGWGGLTLLATLVFFGPTILRTRLESGAERRAAPALRHGATGLTIATAALLLSGTGAAPGSGFRMVAAAGLAVYAAAATVVCLDVLKAAARSAHRSPHSAMIRAACAWFCVVAWADVVLVATGRFTLVDALGVVLLMGVLGQAILATLAYLAPMVFGNGPRGRGALRARLDRFPGLRAGAWNAATVLLASAAIAGSSAGGAGAAAIRLGWALAITALLTQVVLTTPRSNRLTPGG